MGTLCFALPTFFREGELIINSEYVQDFATLLQRMRHIEALAKTDGSVLRSLSAIALATADSVAGEDLNYNILVA